MQAFFGQVVRKLRSKGRSVLHGILIIWRIARRRVVNASPEKEDAFAVSNRFIKIFYCRHIGFLYLEVISQCR